MHFLAVLRDFVVDLDFSRQVKFSVCSQFNVTTGWDHLLLWSPYVIGQTIIFLPCGYYLSIYLSFFPRLISAAGDWMSTILPHMVWP